MINYIQRSCRCQLKKIKFLPLDTNVGSLEEVHKIVTDNADKYPNGKWELYPMQLAV